MLRTDLSRGDKLLGVQIKNNAANGTEKEFSEVRWKPEQWYKECFKKERVVWNIDKGLHKMRTKK